MWFEIIGRAAAPVHDVLVLALTAQLTIPVGDTQVVVHQSVAHVTVPEHRVEEGLGERANATFLLCDCKFLYTVSKLWKCTTLYHQMTGGIKP